MPFYGLVKIHGVKRWDIKTGNPHIDKNDYLEIRFFILEFLGVVFTVIIGPDNRLHFGGIVLGTATDELDLFNVHRITANFISVVFRRALAFFKPFRAERLDAFIDFKPDFTVIAHKHCLAVYGSIFTATFFIMANKVIDNNIKATCSPQNCLDLEHIPLRLLNLVGICAGVCHRFVEFIANFSLTFI